MISDQRRQLLSSAAHLEPFPAAYFDFYQRAEVPYSEFERTYCRLLSYVKSFKMSDCTMSLIKCPLYWVLIWLPNFDLTHWPKSSCKIYRVYWIYTKYRIYRIPNTEYTECRIYQTYWLYRKPKERLFIQKLKWGLFDSIIMKIKIRSDCFLTHGASISVYQGGAGSHVF